MLEGQFTPQRSPQRHSSLLLRKNAARRRRRRLRRRPAKRPPSPPTRACRLGVETPVPSRPACTPQQQQRAQVGASARSGATDFLFWNARRRRVQASKPYSAAVRRTHAHPPASERCSSRTRHPFVVVVFEPWGWRCAFLRAPPPRSTPPPWATSSQNCLGTKRCASSCSGWTRQGKPVRSRTGPCAAHGTNGSAQRC